MAGEKVASEGGMNRYFLFFDLCALLFVAAKGMELAGVNESAITGVGLVWLLLLITLFSRKRRDEFAQYCWAKAVQAAFAMLLIVPFVWGFSAGIADGLADRTVDRDTPWSEIIDLVFLTFFAAFEWARFRGGRP